jgi:peptidoglycan-N-acetylglucosamine deacetylase
LRRTALTGEGYYLLSSGSQLKIENRPIFWRVDTSQKIVALTFDDGPHPVYTEKILKILKAKGVKATFFVVGQDAARYPQVVKDEVAAGCEVENHSYTHPQLDLESHASMDREIAKTDAVIERLTGRRPMFFRPPKGLMGVDLFDRVDSAGLTVALWSGSLERSASPSPRSEALRLAGETHPGFVLLAHDGRLDRHKTVEALPYLIDELQKHGYIFVTMAELYRTANPPKQLGWEYNSR